MTIRQVISEMEKQTGKFFGFSTQLDLSRTIRLDKLDMPVDDVIREIMGSEFLVEQDGNYILLYHKDLAPTGFISGRFIHAGNMNPIQGIVFISDSIEIKTDRRGYFQSEKLPEGKYIVRFSAGNYEPAYRELNTTEEVDFQTIVRLTPVTETATVGEPERLLAVEPVKPTFEEYLRRQPKEAGNLFQEEITGYRNFKPTRTDYLKGYPKLALKTNAVWWTIGTLNAAAEARILPQWSADLSVMARPWKTSGDKSFELWLIQPEVRYWFCDVFEKHFIGIHGSYAHYKVGNLDIGLPLLKDNYLDGNAWGIGLTYGYHMPLGKRWGLELSLGMGFLNMKYDEYSEGMDGGITQKDSRYYIGPTKLGVSFFYMIR